MQRSFLKVAGLIALATLLAGGLRAQMMYSGELVEVVWTHDSTTQKVIRNPELFREGWQNLAQVKFWRRVMRLSPDYAYLNVADTRQILMGVHLDQFNRQSPARQQAIKDSALQANNLPIGTRLYLTSGKSDFYQIHAALPSIHKGIQVFMNEGVDPWYAQAILLIESPGANRHSSVGAAGQFQLMKDVAIDHGLVVNSTRDDRLVFDRAAKGAARHLERICIPQTKSILDDMGIAYTEQDLWFRLLVLHTYHAGAGNVRAAMRKLNPTEGNKYLIPSLWQTSAAGFQNASQNYSQLAISALIELEVVLRNEARPAPATSRTQAPPVAVRRGLD